MAYRQNFVNCPNNVEQDFIQRKPCINLDFIQREPYVERYNTCSPLRNLMINHSGFIYDGLDFTEVMNRVHGRHNFYLCLEFQRLHKTLSVVKNSFKCKRKGCGVSELFEVLKYDIINIINLKQNPSYSVYETQLAVIGKDNFKGYISLGRIQDFITGILWHNTKNCLWCDVRLI